MLCAQVHPFAFQYNICMPKPDMQMADLLAVSVLMQNFLHTTVVCVNLEVNWWRDLKQSNHTMHLEDQMRQKLESLTGASVYFIILIQGGLWSKLEVLETNSRWPPSQSDLGAVS